MTALIQFAARNSWAILGALLFITLVAGSRLGQLELSVSFDKMMLEDGEASHVYNELREMFGDQEGTLVFLRDEHLLAPDNVQAIQSTILDIESLPFVSATTSLFSLKDVWVDEKEQVLSAPYLDGAHSPRSPEERSLWLAKTLKNPLIEGRFLSDDGKAMAVSVLFRKIPGGPDSDAKMVAEIERLITPLTKRLRTAFQIGPPVIRQAINTKIRHDQRLIVPAALGVLLLMLAVILRRLNGALVPLITGAMSVIWTLGLMATLGIQVNVMTSIVPALLAIVGCTEDIHLIEEYYAGRHRGLAQNQALRRMADRVGVAVLLTFLTTGVGFLSIAINPITMLREFGLMAGIGLAFNFLITILLVPAWLKLFGGRAETARRVTKEDLLPRLMLGLTRWVIRYKGTVLALTLFSILASLAGASRSKVDNDPRVTSNLENSCCDGSIPWNGTSPAPTTFRSSWMPGSKTPSSQADGRARRGSD